jgi:anti-sigma factor RsiW
MRASEMPAQAHVVAWAREEATERTGLLRLGLRCALGRSKEPAAAAGHLPERVLGRGAAQQSASTIGPRARKRAFGPRAGKKSAAVKQAFGLKYTVTSLKSVLLFQKHI